MTELKSTNPKRTILGRDLGDGRTEYVISEGASHHALKVTDDSAPPSTYIVEWLERGLDLFIESIAEPWITEDIIALLMSRRDECPVYVPIHQQPDFSRNPVTSPARRTFVTRSATFAPWRLDRPIPYPGEVHQIFGRPCLVYGVKWFAQDVRLRMWVEG